MPTAILEKSEWNLSQDGERRLQGFPEVLQTPSGLALVEIQGTIQVGTKPLARTGLELNGSEDWFNSVQNEGHTHFLGNMEFLDDNQVVFNVGNHQRIRGTVVKMKNPLAILKLPSDGQTDKAVENSQLSSQVLNEGPMTDHSNDIQDIHGIAHVSVMEIIKYKVVFKTRPEPIVFQN